MLEVIKKNQQEGFSILEIILASAVFVTFATAAVVAVIQGYNANRLGAEFTIANQFAAEGIEAARSIKNQAYTNLNAPLGGVRRKLASPFTWEFFGATNTFNVSKAYTRTLAVTDVQRDCATGDIATSGTTYADPNTHKITSTVNWQFNSNGSRPESIDLVTYLTDWRKTIPSFGTLGGGMLVYGDGGTTTDAISYKTLSATTGLWSSAANINFDPSAPNKVLKAIRMDSSSTRTEKIVMSRHIAGTNAQSIWVHVWNGSDWSSLQLSSWTTTTATDARNFDGDYLSNGNFILIYSDNTSIPKYRIWDGRCWSSQASLVNLANNGSATPYYITARVRPGTNEVMVVTFGSGRDTNTQYYNGSSWTLHPRHSATGPADKEMIDFAWSPVSSTKGALVFPDSPSGTDSRNISLKIFTANGSGGGTWSSEVDSANSTGTIGALDVEGRPGTEEFVSCEKDTSNDIFCFRGNSVPNPPTWTSPTNNTMTASTDIGIQRSYDFAYEAQGGSLGINVYSDTTAIPKLKKYTPSTNTFDAAATNLTTVSVALETVKMRQSPNSDDIMIMMGNTSNDLYTVIWNGAANAVYTTPAGKAHTTHQPSTSGSADTDFYYDFAWDKF